jgi:hypothetical protein
MCQGEVYPVPTKEDMLKDLLRECADMLVKAIRVSSMDWQDKLTPLKDSINAALAAEENSDEQR